VSGITVLDIIAILQAAQNRWQKRYLLQQKE
jgi:hypothetical protein